MIWCVSALQMSEIMFWANARASCFFRSFVRIKNVKSTRVQLMEWALMQLELKIYKPYDFVVLLRWLTTDSYDNTIHMDFSSRCEHDIIVESSVMILNLMTFEFWPRAT